MNTSNMVGTGREWFGLFAIIESTRVVLPLKGVECNFTVEGGVAEVSMSQVFRQENSKALDCQYSFPLPADASVYSCEADINGRLIRAQVQETKAARKLAEEKKAEGFRTALVESVRDNLFTLDLGNVQPGDLIVITLKYFQPLRTLGETRSLEIPFCPGVRYIPGTPLLRRNSGKGVEDDTNEAPDASRISPVRIDAEHPDAAYIDVRGRLDAEYIIAQSLTSPSHNLDVTPQNGRVNVTLSSKGEVPDRDFVLRWEERPAGAVVPRAWLQQKGPESYALMEVRAPREANNNATTLDFYFLVDRSGSMQGMKWVKAVEALQSCVNILGPGDRAMVTLFESRFRDFAEQPLPAQTLLADDQFKSLQRLGVAGGTEMAPALKHVLAVARKKSVGREKVLILITDAQVGNESAILELMSEAPDVAVHCFGIDIALNDALLLALARQQGGTFHSLNPNDDIPSLVTKLGQTLRQPVLLDLRISEGWETADAKIPNLYSGQTVYLSAKGSATRPLELTARTPAGETISYKFESRTVPIEAPFLQWSKTRIQRMLAENHETEAVKLSVASNLLCRLTAFIAWDESEKVAVAQHELAQPSLAPAGYASITRGGGMAVAAAPASKKSRTFEARSRGILYRDVSAPARAAISELSMDAELLHEAPARTRLADLAAVCQRLAGSEWEKSYQAIAQWHGNASLDAITAIDTNREKLIQQLHLLADLLEALTAGGGGLIRRLRLWRLQFRMLLQRRKTNGEWQDLETIRRAIEQVDSSTSDERLAVLKCEVQQKAVELLRRFASSLPAGKQPTPAA